MADTQIVANASQDQLMREGESGPPSPKERKKSEWHQTPAGRRWGARARRGMIIGGFVADESELPPDLQNKIVKTSKKDSLGQLKLRRFSGVERDKTAKVIRKFERELTGGKDDIIEKMEALEGKGELNKEQFAILEVLRKKHNISLERAIVEAGAKPLAVMDAYAKGCVALAKLEAITIAHQGMPAVVRDLCRHAVDGTDICNVCVGAGRVPRRPGADALTEVCPRCRGEKVIHKAPSEIKEFAVGKILEITKMVEKGGPVVNVQTNVGVKVGGGGTVLDRLSLLADEVLYGRGKGSPPDGVVEAEVVEGRGEAPSGE